jgi:ADP-heptose:LPS heptosyltransferase
MVAGEPTGAGRFWARPRRQRGRYAAFSSRLSGFLAVTDLVHGFAQKRAGVLQPGGPWRILFSNPAHLGDMVAHLPLLARLAASPQVSALTVLASPQGQAVLKTFLPQLPVMTYEHWSLNRGAGGRFSKIGKDLKARSPLVKALKDQSFDVAIDSYAWFGNAASVLWSAGIPVRLGFESGGGGALFTHPLPFAFPGPDMPIAARTEALLAPLKEAGLTLPEHAPLSFTVDEQALAAISGRYAVLHLGRGEHGQGWTLEGWRAVALGLRSRGFKLVFTGAAAEADYGRALRAELADHDLLGQGGLGYFATVLKQAAVLVSVDTVAPHLAGLFETPTVIVSNGRQVLPMWRPPHARVRQVMSPVACAPCFRKEGCAAMACIRLTKAEAVLAAVDDVVSSAG